MSLSGAHGLLGGPPSSSGGFPSSGGPPSSTGPPSSYGAFSFGAPAPPSEAAAESAAGSASGRARRASVSESEADGDKPRSRRGSRDSMPRLFSERELLRGTDGLSRAMGMVPLPQLSMDLDSPRASAAGRKSPAYRSAEAAGPCPGSAAVRRNSPKYHSPQAPRAATAVEDASPGAPRRRLSLSSLTPRKPEYPRARSLPGVSPGGASAEAADLHRTVSETSTLSEEFTAVCCVPLALCEPEKPTAESQGPPGGHQAKFQQAFFKERL